MAQREPKRWITINGKHIPIFEDENGKEYFGVGQEETPTSSSSTSERRKRVNQEELTNERIMSEIAGEDSYATAEDYRQLLKNSGEMFDEHFDIQDKIEALNEELKNERTIPSKEEMPGMSKWEREMFAEYTERGTAINEEIKALREHDKELNERREKNNKHIKDIDRFYQERQQEAYANRQSSTITSEVKDEYFGFVPRETTTPYIDDALEKGDAFVVQMSPKQYIEECAYKIFPKQYEGDPDHVTTLETTLRGRRAQEVAKYMTMMEEGVKFDTPYLNYRDSQQEGMHRAMAAYLLGVEEMPVVILPKRR